MADDAGSAAGATTERRWLVLVGISVLSFVGFVDFTIVNTILPGIQADLGVSVGELPWVMNAFTVALAVFMISMGRFGDIHGRRKALYLGTLLFAAASFGAGSAQASTQLIACRAVQGVAAAISFTCAAALVTHHFPKDEQGRALGIFMSITALGLAIGPVLGDLSLSFLSWRWAFFVNLPVVVLGFLICWRVVGETPRQDQERIDWAGLALFTPGLGLVILAIMQGNDWGWGSGSVLGTFAVGVACLAGFVLVERRVASPMIDFAFFRNGSFQAAIIAAVALGGFIAVGNFLPPLYLMNVRNEVPYVAGLMLLPISGLVALLPATIGRASDKAGPLPFLIGGQCLLVVAALVQMRLGPESVPWFVLAGFALFGLGWGLQQSTTAVAATAGVPPAAAGFAIGALYTFWNVGASVGLAIAGLIFEAVDKASLDAAVAGERLSLTAADQATIRSLLSDPGQAREALAHLGPDLEARIIPLFRQSFMEGYAAAMTYLAVTCGIAVVLLVIVRMRAGAQRRA